MIWLWAGLWAAGSGIAMAVQGAMNAQASRRVGLPFALVLVFATALLPSLAWALLRWSPATVQRITALPLVFWASGPLSAFITLAVMRSVGMMGVGATTGVVVASQVLASVLLDQLGAFGLRAVPWSFTRVLGSVLLVAGGYLLVKR
jgi:transporter family-2 protein